MDVGHQNHAARRMLAALLSFSREFRSLSTEIEPDAFGLSGAEFRVVVDRLANAGLVTPKGDEACAITQDGLAAAQDQVRLDELFPVDGDPNAPLTSELELLGTRPFEPVSNPPPPMSWDDYSAHLNQVWPRFLDSADQNDERAFQDFLERNACLLPQTFDSFGRGATPKKLIYFTQPELPGFRAKRPDFMTITWDSEAVIATMIELEAPGKPWTTKAGNQNAKLTQAIGQLRDWKAWFREPESVLQFTKLYGIDQRTLETRQFFQRYILVYGRRREAQRNPAFAKQRALLAQSDEKFMTYDRLAPAGRMHDCPTVRVDRSRPDADFSVMHVPPTLTFSPHNMRLLARLPGLREAILANRLITEARREFLLTRLEYWEAWVETKPVIDQSRLTVQQYYAE